MSYLIEYIDFLIKALTFLYVITIVWGEQFFIIINEIPMILCKSNWSVAIHEGY